MQIFFYRSVPVAILALFYLYQRQIYFAEYSKTSEGRWVKIVLIGKMIEKVFDLIEKLYD